MTKSTLWLRNPEHSPTEVNGKFVELDVYEKSSGFRANGIHRMRVQYHPKTSGLFCIWVAFDDFEMAMDDIDEHNLKAHPEPSKADYICVAKYR
jgi:hypothetical protein